MKEYVSKLKQIDFQTEVVINVHHSRMERNKEQAYEVIRAIAKRIGLKKYEIICDSYKGTDWIQINGKEDTPKITVFYDVEEAK